MRVNYGKRCKCTMTYFEILSVFAGSPIPYPKREFLSDEEQDNDKSDSSKVIVTKSKEHIYLFSFVPFVPFMFGR